ncbi:DNA polymerase [Polaromonas sp. CG_23.6]|uniref:DNA polymerase n=1 Tax=Polaromonas sp. CG_23.6 TaxID=2760709 RepID=UPI0024731B4E|nr:DNA polymerase [Polaromonas sp. CG_23.6]MDH6183581.1 hypothetical protein [Polaromonas sp. CG_23.6]
MTINSSHESDFSLPAEERCSSGAGDYIQQTYTDPLSELELDPFDDSFFDPEADLERQLQVADNELKDFAADPTRPCPGRGPELHVGLDAEWEFDPVTNQNNILSVQFFLIGEHGSYPRVMYPKGFHKDDRLNFAKSLATVIAEAMAKGFVYEWPSRIIVCGFVVRVDLAAFSDLAQFKHQIDNVGGRAATLGKDAVLEAELDPQDVANITRNRSSVVDDNSVMRLMKIRFIDTTRHAPEGTSLKQMGDILGCPKLDLPEGYDIARMGELLQGDKPAFEAYGLRDAEIPVRYMLKLQDFARTQTGAKSLPATASGLGVKMFLKSLEASGADYHDVFGLKTVSDTLYSKSGERGKGGVKTITEDVATGFRAIHEPFISDCYHGGRNECYLFGPTEIGIWNDFDLAGAYTTGLVDLCHFEYRVKFTTNPEDFRGHTLGFAWVKFSHPETVRYPVLPVRHERLGLVFPMAGESYCTAPEIEVALSLGCEIEVLHGIVYTWKTGDDRIFEPFTKRIRELRAAHPKGSLREQYAKLLGNSCYGKTAQGLHEKRVFESRTLKTVNLPHSQITNAAMAAHTTGFVRAVLAETMNSIPAHHQVVSVTTDGFLTTADQKDLDLNGPMARRYQALCERVAPDKGMLECKHQVSQLIPFRTRGQLTAEPYGDGDVVLAKAGVSPPPSLRKKDHNAYMLDLFLNRQTGDKTQTRSFTSMRDQWVTGEDVFMKTQDVSLNMEFDMKRRPCNPSMRAAHGVEHLVFETVPWPTASEGERARAYFDEWRRKNCLKTLDDYQRWQEHYQFAGARAKRQKAGARGTGINATAEGTLGLARRGFLRAYAQGAWGLTRTMSYPQLAAWLTALGYPTKADELKNAKRASLVEGVVPDSPQVRALLDVLKAQFPALEVDQFLVVPTGT